MKICVLEEASNPEHTRLGDQDWPTVILPYLEGHHCEVHQLEKESSPERIAVLARQGFDVFINLCDGSWDSAGPGIEVVQSLERLGVAFTGASSSFYDPSREEMKQACANVGIDTPPYVMARDTNDVARAGHTLSFPLIVKHPNGYSSWGITRDSRVASVEALSRQASLSIERFGAALIEEFVEGREFTVLVVENPDGEAPVVYEPVEFRFPAGETFKHYDLKWKDFHGMTCVTLDDAVLSERLKDDARRMFVEMRGDGYARCDVRMDGQGRLFMLEINPNCGLFYAPEDAGSGDFILLNDPGGHAGFLDLIITSARKRVRVQR